MHPGLTGDALTPGPRGPRAFREAAPPGPPVPWGAAPLKLAALWRLRPQALALEGCAHKPLQWLCFLITFVHPLIFIRNY